MWNMTSGMKSRHFYIKVRDIENLTGQVMSYRRNGRTVQVVSYRHSGRTRQVVSYRHSGRIRQVVSYRHS